MKEFLLQLGFTVKEVIVYLSLLELGTQPAAFIAKKIDIPKSTTLFICENLVERGYVRRTTRGRTQFFSADPQDLQVAKSASLATQQAALDKVVPLLQETKSPFSQTPKVSLFQGLVECRTAYLKLLESQTDILEFGTHKTLVAQFGDKFMDDFIAQRTKRNIHLRSIGPKDEVEAALSMLNNVQERTMAFFDPKKGDMYSCIAVYENKVLLLNLHQGSFGVLIENHEFSTTIRTLFELLWPFLEKAR